MFTKVIVGIDGGAGGRDALSLAGELASPRGEIALANVYVFSHFGAGERAQALALLEAAHREAARESKLYPVAASSVGRGLHELADEIGADLIVVGSSRRGLWGRVLQGDDMRAALNGAPCAVAVAPAGYSDRPRVLGEVGVGYDGSHESRHALAVARALAQEHRAKTSAFEAVAIQAGFSDPRHPSHETVEAAVENAYDRLAALGDVEPHAAYGDPAEELALFGASVDLLVVGSRGYGPVGRLIHGSTTLRLARSARCPLLVLPRTAPTTSESVTAGEPSATVKTSA